MKMQWRVAIRYLASGLLAQAGALAVSQELLRTDSPAQYVHRITLYDHAGRAIDPADPDAPPYSPIRTCGKCHEVGQVSHGWHFNAWESHAATQPRSHEGANVPPGRAGEPWILTDRASGTQVPLSYRGWEGVFSPEEFGLTPWDMTLRFAHHIPGGGFGSPLAPPGETGPGAAGAQTAPQATPAAAIAPGGRWAISGVLEIDCMMCHSAGAEHDPAELERQIERQNFRWAPTAALGLGILRGDAKSLPDDYDPAVPPPPDRQDLKPPTIQYDKSRFDGDNRVYFNVTRRPPVDRCLFCHGTRVVGPTAPPKWLTSADVHISAGLLCTDCHRNDIGHDITRGYPDEAATRGEPARAALSCEGCHLGVRAAPRTGGATGATSADNPMAIRAVGGLYGAPHPQHGGLPAFHLQLLTCTACHSGPWPEQTPRRFQTAMAHGLGVPTKLRRDDDPPRIVGPYFERGVDGQITPMRVVDTAFFAREKDGKFRPIPLSAVQQAIRKLRGRESARRNAPASAPSADELKILLGQLSSADGRAAYLHNGWASYLADGGALETRFEPTAAAYAWPIAHDVRPARHALGAVRGCQDCHREDSPLYTGAQSAKPGAPGAADATAAQPRRALHPEQPALLRAWAIVMANRTVAEIGGWFLATVVGCVATWFIASGLIGFIQRTCGWRRN